MNKIAKDYITESNGKFTVHGHTGRSFGTYQSKGEAEKRLGQVEYFKKHASDMEPGKMKVLRDLFGEFLDEEADEPEHQELPSKPLAAGIVLQAPSGKVLLLKRSPEEKNYGGHWGLPGGKAEDGESPEEAARREAFEETGHPVLSDLRELSRVDTPNGFQFITFIARCTEEFTPVLGDGEHTDSAWDHPINWVIFTGDKRVHPGVEKTLWEMCPEGASDSIAMDKDTVRSFDDVGRMKVDLAHISKACINPYYGKEIPGADVLGLIPEKIYYLLRDPVELEKAAPTFNGIQVLIRHIPVSADDPQTEEIVGATGTDAKFNSPYLDNSLSIWDGAGIEVIENGLQKELSCGYSYVPVMEPGIFNGEPYDGRMTNIKGNHVALVNKGRAGPDVVVGDEALKPLKENAMKTKLLSRTAVMLQAALSAHIMPKIALDSQLKLTTALSTGLSQIGESEKITRLALKKPNFRKAIVKMARDAAEPMMTPEAKKEGIGPDHVMMRLLDMVEGAAPEAEPEQVTAGEEADGEEPAGQEWRKSAIDAMCGKGMSEDDANAVCDMFPKNDAAVAKEPGEAKDDEEMSEDEETEEQKKEKEAMAAKKAEDDKKAMDSAIAVAREGAKKDTMQLLSDIRKAEAAVRPLIGEVSMACDSADAIYIAALKHYGIKTEGVHSSALPAMVDILVESRNKKKGASEIAQDADTTVDARDKFNEAFSLPKSTIRHLGAN